MIARNIRIYIRKEEREGKEEKEKKKEDFFIYLFLYFVSFCVNMNVACMGR